MKKSDWQLASTLARDLVNRETDINEVQKAVTYARVHAGRPSEKVGEKFFSLLDTMTRDGRYLVRSARTLDYYRDLRDICNQHLGKYRTATGECGRELVEILAWATRLMRYYNSDPGKSEQANIKQFSEHKQTTQQTTPATEKSHVIPQPLAPPLLPVREETKREHVTLTAEPKGGKARVQTSTGEEITCENLPTYPRASVGDVCSADVTRRTGQAVKAVFKGWVQK